MIKESVQEGDITIVNIYAPQHRGTSLHKAITNRHNRGNRQQDHKKKTINKETQTLNETLDQMDLIDTFRTFHPNAEEYTFFSSAYGTFSRIDHILGHRSTLSKFKKIEIISGIFSDHNTVRLDINYRKNNNNNNSEKQKLMEIK